MDDLSMHKVMATPLLKLCILGSSWLMTVQELTWLMVLSHSASPEVLTARQPPELAISRMAHSIACVGSTLQSF